MKKFMLVLMTIMILIAACGIAEETAHEPLYLRRGVTMGMTKQQVIDCEGEEYDTNSGRQVAYSNEIAQGFFAYIDYQFNTAGELYLLYVGFTDMQVSFAEVDSIEAFNEIEEALTAKYGGPSDFSEKREAASSSNYPVTYRNVEGIEIVHEINERTRYHTITYTDPSRKTTEQFDDL